VSWLTKIVQKIIFVSLLECSKKVQKKKKKKHIRASLAIIDKIPGEKTIVYLAVVEKLENH
jgi:hypothetical protein